METGAYPIPRRSERISVTIPVTLLVASEIERTENSVWTVDLSQIGARVRTSAALKPGQTVEFVPHEGRRYVLRSRVVWIKPGGPDREAEVGLEFLNPLPA